MLHAGHASKHRSQRQRLWHDTKVLLSNPEAVPFFAMSLLMGFGVGVLSTYLFLYVDELGKLPLHPLDKALDVRAIVSVNNVFCLLVALP